MPRLSEHGRSEAIGMLRAGMRRAEIARRLQCHVSTIARLQQRFRETGSVKYRPRPGQPKITTRRQDGAITGIHRRYRFRPASVTARRTVGRRGYVIISPIPDFFDSSQIVRPFINFKFRFPIPYSLDKSSSCKWIPPLYNSRRPFHPKTVRRRLRNVGLYCRRPAKGVILTDRHKAERLRWATTYHRYTQRQWGMVLFSDESKFNVSHCDGRKRVYRLKGERFKDNCVLKWDRWGGGSVHVWGGITRNEKTELVVLERNVTAETYINDVLDPVVIPFMRRHFQRGRGILQQDNAPAHRARRTTIHLQQNDVNVMPWPALSPDMAHIEHVWDELGRRVRARVPPPADVRQLRDALLEEWNNLPQQRITNIVSSMRRRCRACIASDGSYTRYWFCDFDMLYWRQSKLHKMHNFCDKAMKFAHVVLNTLISFSVRF